MCLTFDYSKFWLKYLATFNRLTRTRSGNGITRKVILPSLQFLTHPSFFSISSFHPFLHTLFSIFLAILYSTRSRILDTGATFSRSRRGKWNRALLAGRDIFTKNRYSTWMFHAIIGRGRTRLLEINPAFVTFPHLF